METCERERERERERRRGMPKNEIASFKSQAAAIACARAALLLSSLRPPPRHLYPISAVPPRHDAVDYLVCVNLRRSREGRRRKSDCLGKIELVFLILLMFLISLLLWILVSLEWN